MADEGYRDDRIMVAMVTYPEGSIEELDLAWLWPNVPRIGDHLVWSTEDRTMWQATVWEVIWHLDPELTDNNARVWLGAGTAKVYDDVEPHPALLGDGS